MAPSAEIVALVGKIPPLDSKDYKPPLLKTRPSDGKFTGPTWGEAEGIFDGILKRGKEGITDVIDMLKEVDNGADYRARYVLHGIAIYVCRADKQEQQDMLIDTLASQLAGRPVPIQKFLVRELQVCADERVAKTLGKMLTDPKMCDTAALALMAIRKGAVEQFRAALPKATGRCRLVVIQNLGLLRDEQSIAALKQAASDSDREVRISAVAGLANIGDAGSVDVVIQAAGAKPGWERIQGAEACLKLAEKLQAAGKAAEARRIYTYLRDTRKDESESYVRQAAVKALG